MKSFLATCVTSPLVVAISLTILSVVLSAILTVIPRVPARDGSSCMMPRLAYVKLALVVFTVCFTLLRFVVMPSSSEVLYNIETGQPDF